MDLYPHFSDIIWSTRYSEFSIELDYFLSFSVDLEYCFKSVYWN